MNKTYKKFLPHTIAVVVFAIITLIYFRPLLSGKVLKQDDIARHKGMSKEIADFRDKHQEEPLWTNSMFGGMPAYQISTLYPGNLANKLDAAFKLFLPHPGGYLFLYCLGFFILLLCLEVNVWLALIGGLAYGLSSYFLIILEAGHNSKANALGYLPALIGGVILLFRQRYWLGLALTAIFTAMELNANHVQISYYGYMLLAFIIAGYFFEAFKDKQLKSYFTALGLFLFATLLGALPNAGNLLTTNEYGKYSTRGKSELTIDYNSIREARMKFSNNGGKVANAEELIDEAARQRRAANVTSGLDKDYATNWSYGIGETFTFLIPDFKGGASSTIGNSDKNALKKVKADFREQVASSNAYFGDQPFTSGPVYIGSIIVFLALLGMFIVKNTLKWPVFFATVLTVALAWGNNLMSLTDFFMDHVPGYNKFRAVSMLMVIAELTLPLLAIMAVHELISKPQQNIRFYVGGSLAKVRILHSLFISAIKKFFSKKEQTGAEGRTYVELEPKKVLIIPFIIVGGFCLVSYLMPDLLNNFQAANEEEEYVREAVRAGNPESEVRPYIAELMPQIETARKAIFRSDALRSLIFVVLGFGALYLYLINKLKRELFFAAIGLFVVIDLWTVDTRYLNEKSFITKSQNQQYLTRLTETDEAILKDTTLDYRVLNLASSTFNDAATSYHHKSIGGYHGAKLKKYAELIDFHLEEEINSFRRNAGKAFGSDSALNALLSKLHVINMLNTKYFIIPAGERGQTLPLPNMNAYGNAWFVKSIKTVPDSDNEILGLYDIDPKVEAVLKEKYRSELAIREAYSGEGNIDLVSYEPNHLVYESETANEQFAVFSEIYYPKGWNAYVDGELKAHANVNYVLRGLGIPAGKHKIEFKFEPQSYKVGNNVALMGSILMFAVVGLGLFKGARPQKQKSA